MTALKRKMIKIILLTGFTAFILPNILVPSIAQTSTANASDNRPITSPSPQSAINIEEMTLTDIAAAIRSGKTTSLIVTQAYLDRIAAIDRAGPMLNSIIATMPDALAQAKALDDELAAGKIRGPLHGVPIIVKDNIEVAGNVPTTAGSFALINNITNRDAPLVANLRQSGAVILGKANLSQWANIRSTNSTSGWSSVGGLVKNPYALDRNACGSSSGSGAAAAASLAAATVGTETDGSVICPSAINGVVGIKPTVGLVSRRHIIPISHSQDTAGPMARTVRDAAILLSAMAGRDAGDPATNDADKWRGDFTSGLNADGLRGLRIVVPTDRLGSNPQHIAMFNQMLDKIRAAGATIIEAKDTRTGYDGLGEAEYFVLLTELKTDMAEYLQSLPEGLVPHKTLADLIAFNKANADPELTHFGQEIFEQAEQTGGTDDPAYADARAKSLDLAGRKGIDGILSLYNADMILQLSNGPSWLSTLGEGDNFSGPSASNWAAVAGYPHITVPMGYLNELPVGISFIGRKWHDHAVIKAGYAFEQLTKARVKPSYQASVSETEE